MVIQQWSWDEKKVKFAYNKHDLVYVLFEEKEILNTLLFALNYKKIIKTLNTSQQSSKTVIFNDRKKSHEVFIWNEQNVIKQVIKS